MTQASQEPSEPKPEPNSEPESADGIESAKAEPEPEEKAEPGAEPGPEAGDKAEAEAESLGKAEPGAELGLAVAGSPTEPVGPPPVPPAAPPRKRRVGLIVTLGVLAVIVLACVVGGILFVGAVRGEIPAAGDCLTDAADATDMDVVACGSGDAAWTVIGSDGQMSRGAFTGLTQGDQVCQEHPGTERALWVTDTWFGVSDDTEGEVVCLERVG